MNIHGFKSWVDLARIPDDAERSVVEELELCNENIARTRVDTFIRHEVPVFDIARGAKIGRKYLELLNGNKDHYAPYFDRVEDADRAIRTDSGVNAGILGALSVHDDEIERAVAGEVFRVGLLHSEAQIVPVTLQQIPNIALKALLNRVQSDLSQLTIVTSPSVLE